MKKLEINIPEGKKPKMVEEENRCVIEWVPGEKTFGDYVEEFADVIKKRRGILLVPWSVMQWNKMLKFGLLQFIADDLNEEKLDWNNHNQGKYCVCYNYRNKAVSRDAWHYLACAGYIFTETASQKAMKIIPAEFLKTF